MKIFIFSYESTRKTGKNSIDHFLISFPVLEISTFKKTLLTYPRNFGEILTKEVTFVMSPGFHVNREIIKST